MVLKKISGNLLLRMCYAFGKIFIFTMENLILIKGAGEMASAIAHRLVKCKFPVLMTEIEKPSVIRRNVSFAQAIFSGKHSFQEISAQKVCKNDFEMIKKILQNQMIPILVDPDTISIKTLKPLIVIDAILAKTNLGTKINDASLVIGLGPGFTAQNDVHVVIETNRGHNLGKIIKKGCAEPNTNIPGNIAGYTTKRVIRAPQTGVFISNVKIGACVLCGDVLGFIEKIPVKAKISGIVRGLIFDGYNCSKNMKIADIDPRGKIEYCDSISDKARNISGSILELVITHKNSISDLLQ